MMPTNPRQRKTIGSSRMLSPPFYVIADTHWFHKNIVKYCNRDPDHNWIMVNRWNKAVGPDDTVLHLGDLILTASAERQYEFFEVIAPSLMGRKLLILGNHDKKRLIPRYEEAGFKIIKPFNMRYREYDISFDHYPTAPGLIEKGDKQIRVHGHIHNHGYQHIHTSRKEHKRYGNINVSVEVIDYTPQPIERVLDKAIEEMKDKQPFVHVPAQIRTGFNRY